MTHTLHPENSLKEDMKNRDIDTIIGHLVSQGMLFQAGKVSLGGLNLSKNLAAEYLLPPSQHLKDEQFVEQFEKYCEEELKQSTPKIEKIELTKDDDYWGDTHKKLNEVIDYINNKD